MEIINIKISYGIHILLNMYHIIKSILLINNNKQINIELDVDTLKINRNDIDEKYFEKYLILAKEILNIENVNITLNKKYQYVDWITNFCEILETNKIYILKNNYFTKYNININIQKPYICINTKIVNSSKYFNNDKNPTYNFIEKYNIIKNELFYILNNSQYNIVLLGERNIPNCNEYNFHMNNFGNYIMYNDFINNLNNIIDETYNDTKDGYDLDNWKKTCYYLTHSKLNIYIGNGGGIHLYSNFENTVQFGVTDRLLEWILPENMETKLYSTIDCNDFINKIKLIII
jgi:hypothetical protein